MRDQVNRSGSYHRLPAIAVALCGLVWGGFWYPLRWIDESGLGSAWVSFIFNAVLFSVVLPWILYRATWKSGARGQLLAGLLLGSAFSLYTVSLVMTDVIHAILLFYLTPVWSTVAGLLFWRERMTAPRAAAMALGLGGMFGILGVAHGLPVPRNGGDWVALASGLCWAAGTLRSYHAPSAAIATPVLAFSLGGMASSGVILALATAMSHPLARTEHLAEVLPWTVALALIIFVPPNFLVLWAAQRIDSARVGILLMTEVLAGTVTAALFSGEGFGAAEALGTAMIACAGMMEALGRR